MIKQLIKPKHSGTILIIFLASILLSNIEASTAFNQTFTLTNKNNETLEPYPSIIINTHNITIEEIKQLKSQIGTEQSTQNYNELIDNHGTGLSAPSSDEWKEIAQSADVVDSIYLKDTPEAIDNSASPYFPPIGNQDGEGSCVAWAVGYYVKTYQEAKEHSWDLSGASWIGGTYGSPTLSYQDRIISPDFVYHLINGGQDNGGSFEEAIRLVCAIGASSWSKMPYNPLDHTTWPTENAWREAPFYRGDSTSSYQYIFANTEEGIANLKNWLSAGNLALIAVDANQYSDLSSNDVWTVDNYRTEDLNHANTIVGFDDNMSYTENGVTTYGAFKIANSWGVGGWEKVPDGYYWISYEAMKQLSDSGNPCIIFYDLIDYKPTLSVSYQITHNRRGECSITLGLGTISNPIITKALKSYITGGNVAFCANNIIIDITEFKDYATSFYNQSFFMKVYDTGTLTTGTVNYFAIEESVSTDSPVTTRHYASIYLTVNHSLGTPLIDISPTTGFAGQIVTINGTNFTADNTIILSYLNPSTATWVEIANNIEVSPQGTFTYSLNAPDLNQDSPSGDNPAVYDNIVFAAMDNFSNCIVFSSNPYSEARRGIISLNSVVANGVFGNNTDLCNSIMLQAGQIIDLYCTNFSPGAALVYFDGLTLLSSSTVNEEGRINATFSLPAQVTAGMHTISIKNFESMLLIKISILPQVFTDYDGNWHSSDFNVNLNANGPGVIDIYYSINGGEIKNVNMNGQPLIVSESGANTLEYWGVYQDNNTIVELVHNTLTGIKLDKTAPEGTLKINNNDGNTESCSVSLKVSASDAISGLQKIRFSNDAIWDSEIWQVFNSEIAWQLTSGNGTKNVYCQIMDWAGLTTNIESSIVLTQHTTNLTSSQQTIDQTTPTPTSSNDLVTVSTNGADTTIPEYSFLWIIILLFVLTLSALFVRKQKI